VHIGRCSDAILMQQQTSTDFLCILPMAEGPQAICTENLLKFVRVVDAGGQTDRHTLITISRCPIAGGGRSSDEDCVGIWWC